MPVIGLVHNRYSKVAGILMIYRMLKQLVEKAFLLMFNRAYINAWFGKGMCVKSILSLSLGKS